MPVHILKQLSTIIIAILALPLGGANPVHLEQRDPSSFNFTKRIKLLPADPIVIVTPAPDNIEVVNDEKDKLIRPDFDPDEERGKLAKLEPPDLDQDNERTNLDQSQPEDPDLDDKNDKLTQLQPQEPELDEEKLKLTQLQTLEDTEASVPDNTVKLDDKENNFTKNSLETRGNDLLLPGIGNILENRIVNSSNGTDNNTMLEEWWKEESTTPGDDYDSTPKEPTPDAMPIKRTGLNYLQPCQFYGSQFRKTQMGSASVIKPEKASQFSKHICKLSQRLECIPSKLQEYVDESGQSKNKKEENHMYSGLTPEPTTEDPNANVTVNATIRRPPKDLVGYCRCIRGLGDRPRFIKAKKEDTFNTGCYIPAGFAHASSCANEVSVPYGTMDGGGTNVRKVVGKSKDLCVPNAECRTGYTYIGVRCQCTKKATWQPKTGECWLPDDGNLISALGIRTITIAALAVMILLC